MRPAFASALLAAACLVAAGPTANAQRNPDRLMAQADSQLARVKRTLGPSYNETMQVIHRSGRDSTRRDYDLNMTRGTYVFAGAGDDNVTALWLRLYNGKGAVVAADTSGSRTPRFTFTVAEHGTYYRLEMFLAGCRIPDCYFGVQIYQRQPAR